MWLCCGQAFLHVLVTQRKEKTDRGALLGIKVARIRMKYITLKLLNTEASTVLLMYVFP